jgi:hypothetical protein
VASAIQQATPVSNDDGNADIVDDDDDGGYGDDDFEVRTAATP